MKTELNVVDCTKFEQILFNAVFIYEPSTSTAVTIENTVKVNLSKLSSIYLII